MADEITLTLGDGSVVKGKDYEEAFRNLAQITESKSTYINTLKNEKESVAKERDQFARKVDELSAPPPREVKEGEFDSAEYYKLLNSDPAAANRYWFEHEFGASPQQVASQFQQVTNDVSAFNQRVVAADFVTTHPDFPQTEEAASALRERTQALMREGHPYNLRTVNMAYGDLIDGGKIKPVKVDTNREEDRPNPSLSGSGNQENLDAEVSKFEKMSTDEQAAYLRSKGMMV